MLSARGVRSSSLVQRQRGMETRIEVDLPRIGRKGRSGPAELCSFVKYGFCSLPRRNSHIHHISREWNKDCSDSAFGKIRTIRTLDWTF